ncbi:hypothetical protein DACRYDRAFT_23809 [Dacryopinax primogenitus]|uniref:Uncharacterized protein n=1 Tax=Dacryopinax primogenitus (strain DJM 731) TaxID=1858805 RepID=M5FQM2_DACPD|nr:uncharacterized protein DACRYDRAFT_23809 [Dacryopinax primogenitus]EJT99195.1 hypothetical protein DACRYDRAFT_23809 [Dacryopinax primogenitus]
MLTERGEFVHRFSQLMMKITFVCDRLVRGMFVSDDSYSQAPSYEERGYLVVRQDGSKMVAYRKDLALRSD